MSFEIKDYKTYEFAWRNRGIVPQAPDRLSVKDAIATPNAGMWLPKVITQIVREAQEPLLIGTQLLTRIEHRAGTAITFPAVGAITAADMAEGESYPERQLVMAGATQIATVGKVGIAVKITAEMERYSQFDIINMHLRAAGRALARHKEEKIFSFIRSMGVTVFDNVNPLGSMNGVTHGRNMIGAANGSIISDDLFDMYAQLIHQGFTPDTVLVHPLTWGMFVKDPVLRQMMLSGAGNTWFAQWSGNPQGRAPWDNQGGLGVGNGQYITPGGTPSGAAASPLTEYPQDINSAPQLPNYFPFPFRVLVSPFVWFDPARRLTDIMMFDSRNLGALIVDEELTTDEWNDQSVDIRKIKMRERYGIGIFEEGQAIACARNVKICANEVTLPAQATIATATTSLDPIPAGTPVAGL